MAWSGWVLWSCLVVACGCSSKDHPPAIDEDPIPRGGSSGSAGGTDNTGNTGNTGTGNTGTGNTGTGGGVFDPARVYWSGAAKLYDGETFLNMVGYGSATDPTEAIYGFTVKPAGKLLLDEFIYADGGKILQFQPDRGESLKPENNDARLPTEPCDERLSAWEPTPDGRLIYQCPDNALVWYEDGKVVHEAGDFFRIGNNGHLLLDSLAWSELGSAESQPTEGLSDLSATFFRSYDEGFHVVFGLPGTDYRELWSIEAAVATKLGEFGDPPEGYIAENEALGGDDILYRFGVLDDIGVIVASTIAGDSVVIHEDNSDDYPIALTPQTVSVPLLTGR